MNPCESTEFFTQNEDSENDDPFETQEKRHKNREDHYRINTIAGNIFITPAHSSSSQNRGYKKQYGDTTLRYHQGQACPKSPRPKTPDGPAKHHHRSRSLSIHIRPACKNERTEDEPIKKGVAESSPCNANWGPVYNPPSKSCSNYSVDKASSQGFSAACPRAFPVYQPVQENEYPPEDYCDQFIQNLCEYQQELQSARDNCANPRADALENEGNDNNTCLKDGVIEPESPRERMTLEEVPNTDIDICREDSDIQEKEVQLSDSQFGDRFCFNPRDELKSPKEVKQSAAKERQRKRTRSKKCSEHVFPFRRGPSGNLRVETNMIAFESKQVAVLVDDPTKTRVRFQQIREHCSRNPPPVPPMPKGFSNCPTPTCSPRKATPSNNCTPRSKPPSPTCDLGEPAPAIIERCSGNISPRTATPRTPSPRTPRADIKPCGTREKRHSCDSAGPENIPECCKSGTQNQCRSSKDFMESLYTRLRAAIHHDVKIVIDDQEFPCHAIALQAYSKFFDCMKRPKELVQKIHLPNGVIRAEDFPNLMDWILLDDASKPLVISHCNVLSLFSAAQYLGIPGLKEHCLQYINDKIRTGDPSILLMYEEACGKTNCKDVMGLLGAKLVQLFPMVYKSKQFLKLGSNELMTLIDSDEVKIQSELQIYDTALRWLLYEWDSRAEYAISVMRCVRFGLLSPLQLTQIQHCAEAANMPDYAKIYSIPEIRQMLQNGLTFSILRENYKARPGEFNKWVDWSKVCVPRPRRNLDSSDMIPLSSRMPVDGYPDSEDHFGPNAPNNHTSSAERHYQDPMQETPRSLYSNTSQRSHRSERSRNEKFKESSPKRPTEGEKIPFGNMNYNEPPEGDFENQLEQDRKAVLELLEKESEEPQSLRLSQQAPESQLFDLDGENENADYQDKHHEAATVIQSHVRGHLTRKSLEEDFRRFSNNSSTPRKNYRTLDLMRTKTLLIPGRQAVLLFGGMNPIEPFDNSNNNSQCIYRFDPEKNSWGDMGRLPEPRSHCGVISEQNMIYIFGGGDPRKGTPHGRNLPSAKTWSLNPLNGKWEELSPMNTPRTNFGFCNFRGNIYVFGGKSITGKVLSSCERYSLEEDAWEIISALPIACMSSAVSNFGNSIFVVGGVGKGAKLPILDSVFIYEPQNDTWTRDIPLQFGRCYAQLGSHYDQLYLVGGAGREGRDDNSTRSLKDVCVYEDGEWETVGVLKKPRHGHSMVKIGKHFLILGGVSSDTMEPLNTVEIYNTETNRSSSRVAHMPQKLTGMTAIVI